MKRSEIERMIELFGVKKTFADRYLDLFAKKHPEYLMKTKNDMKIPDDKGYEIIDHLKWQQIKYNKISEYGFCFFEYFSPINTIANQNIWIRLPEAGKHSRQGFPLSFLIDKIIKQRKYDVFNSVKNPLSMIIGKRNCKMKDHPFDFSLDYFLRNRLFVGNKSDTRQATSEVVNQILDTKLFKKGKIKNPKTGYYNDAITLCYNENSIEKNKDFILLNDFFQLGLIAIKKNTQYTDFDKYISDQKKVFSIIGKVDVFLKDSINVSTIKKISNTIYSITRKDSFKLKDLENLPKNQQIKLYKFLYPHAEYNEDDIYFKRMSQDIMNRRIRKGIRDIIESLSKYHQESLGLNFDKKGNLPKNYSFSYKNEKFKRGVRGWPVEFLIGNEPGFDFQIYSPEKDIKLTIEVKNDYKSSISSYIKSHSSNKFVNQLRSVSTSKDSKDLISFILFNNIFYEIVFSGNTFNIYSCIEIPAAFDIERNQHLYQKYNNFRYKELNPDTYNMNMSLDVFYNILFKTIVSSNSLNNPISQPKKELKNLAVYFVLLKQIIDKGKKTLYLKSFKNKNHLQIIESWMKLWKYGGQGRLNKLIRLIVNFYPEINILFLKYNPLKNALKYLGDKGLKEALNILGMIDFNTFNVDDFNNQIESILFDYIRPWRKNTINLMIDLIDINDGERVYDPLYDSEIFLHLSKRRKKIHLTGQSLSSFEEVDYLMIYMILCGYNNFDFEKNNTLIENKEKTTSQKYKKKFTKAMMISPSLFPETKDIFNTHNWYDKSDPNPYRNYDPNEYDISWKYIQHCFRAITKPRGKSETIPKLIFMMSENDIYDSSINNSIEQILKLDLLDSIIKVPGAAEDANEYIMLIHKPLQKQRKNKVLFIDYNEYTDWNADNVIDSYKKNKITDYSRLIDNDKILKEFEGSYRNDRKILPQYYTYLYNYKGEKKYDPVKNKKLKSLDTVLKAVALDSYRRDDDPNGIFDFEREHYAACKAITRSSLKNNIFDKFKFSNQKTAGEDINDMFGDYNKFYHSFSVLDVNKLSDSNFLLTSDHNSNSTVFTPELKISYILSNDIYVYEIINNDIDLEYLELCMHSDKIREQYKALCDTNIMHAGYLQDTLKGIYIEIPEIKIQKKIIESKKEEYSKSKIEELKTKLGLGDKKNQQIQWDIVNAVSHNFNTNLNIISTNSEIMKNVLQREKLLNLNIHPEDENDEQTLQSLLNYIDDEVALALSTIAQTMYIGKKTRDKLEFKSTDLGRFINKAVKRLKNKNDNYDYEKIENKKFMCHIDEVTMNDIIENLIMNAKKYGFVNSEKQYMIQFELSNQIEDDTEYAVIDYRNNGEPTKISNNFYKKWGESTSGSYGIGGAKISKWIDLYNGRMQLTEGLKEGFHIKFIIPLIQNIKE